MRRELWLPAGMNGIRDAARLVCIAQLTVAAGLGVSVGTAAEPDSAAEARAALERAGAFFESIATHGGYVWRYSVDLQDRAGERRTSDSQIWVQPPGTPAVGQAFLRAYEATGDPRHLERALAAADALASGQLESGGWDYLIDFDRERSKSWFRRSDVGVTPAADMSGRLNVSTYDDDTSQSALRLLIAVGRHIEHASDPRAARLRAARDYGLAKVIAAQRPNGGWPQRWDGRSVTSATHPVQPARFPADYPRTHPKTDYSGYYTLNDHTHRDCVLTLLEAARATGRDEYRAAALRGGDFLLRAQLPEPQPAWAQQYNLAMEPAWARAFEPPSVCTLESAAAVRLLIELHLESSDPKYLEPIPRALAWMRRSEIRPGVWARMYELQTNRPIYGDRDGEIHATLAELSPERRTGYGWEGDMGVPAAMKAFEGFERDGRAGTLARRERGVARAKLPERKAAEAERLAPRVREVIGALDAQGRWLRHSGEREEIRSADFIANVELLADYLEATR